MFFLTGFHFFWNKICKACRINTARSSQHVFADSLHPVRSEKIWNVITVKLAEPSSYYRWFLLLIWITHPKENTVGTPLLPFWTERLVISAWPLVDCACCGSQLVLPNSCWVKSLQKCREPEESGWTVVSLFSAIFPLQMWGTSMKTPYKEQKELYRA